jgi:uncharacterized protein (DUF58 family)
VRRRASPRLAVYAALAATAMLLALALGRTDLAVLGAPFAVFVPLALAFGGEPAIRASFSLSSDRVIEGARLEATLELSAPESAVERLDLLVGIPAGLRPDPPPRALALRLAAGEERRFTFMLDARRWGAWQLGAVEFRRHDRFDLERCDGRAQSDVALRVYPELERLRRLVAPLRTQPFAGSQIARAKGEGIEFADIRPFQFGDQVRRINWRASARRGELLLTESNPERTSDVVLLLDGYADVRRAGTGTLEPLIRAAASLAQAHLARRDRVGVITFGTEVTWLAPSSGDRQRYQIVESLIETAVVRSYRWHNVDLLPPRTLPPRALVIALSPLTDRRIVHVLFDLRARGFDLVAVEISPLEHLRPAADEAAALARRLWLLTRDVARFELERAGVAVATLGDAISLSAAVEEVRAYRRFARIGPG